MTAEWITSILSLLRERKIHSDCSYYILQLVCLYAGRVEVVGSVRTNPLLLGFESALDMDTCFEDAFQSILSTTKMYSFDLFEQFLMYIAGSDQYSKYTPQYLQIYSTHPLSSSSSSLPRRLIEVQTTFNKLSVATLRVLLDFPAISTTADITNLSLLYSIRLLHSRQDTVRVLELVTRTFISRKPAVQASTAILLCELGFIALESGLPHIWERMGWLLEITVKALREQGIVCDERVIRCLTCLLSRCRPGVLYDLRQVMTVMERKKEGCTIVQKAVKEWKDPSLLLLSTIIDHVDNEREEWLSEQPHSYYLFYLFSQKVKTVDAVLKTALFSHHSKLPIYLYVLACYYCLFSSLNTHSSSHV